MILSENTNVAGGCAKPIPITPPTSRLARCAGTCRQPKRRGLVGFWSEALVCEQGCNPRKRQAQWRRAFQRAALGPAAPRRCTVPCDLRNLPVSHGEFLCKVDAWPTRWLARLCSAAPCCPDAPRPSRTPRLTAKIFVPVLTYCISPTVCTSIPRPTLRLGLGNQAS
jgi:hypothetical protein